MSKLDEILSKDQEDESLRKYKESLLKEATKGAPTSTDRRRLIVKEFGVQFTNSDRPPILRNCDGAEAIKAFQQEPIVLPEGIEMQFVVRYIVQHDIIHLLRFKNVISKGLVKVKEDQVMGSYPPSAKVQEFKGDIFNAPKGLLGRGTFKCVTKFVDEDKKEHLELKYSLKIEKA